MPPQVRDTDNFLYGNMRIRRVESDPAAGTLSIRAVYAEREERKIFYDCVLYSQIDKSAEGKRIALVAELTPTEYRNIRHQNSAARFQKECRLQNLDSLEEMSRLGYRFFFHYIGALNDYIVIAKSLSGY